MIQRCALAAEQDSSLLGCIKECQQAEKGDPSPVLNTGVNKSEVLGPVLASSIKGRPGHARVSPAKGHKDV